MVAKWLQVQHFMPEHTSASQAAAEAEQDEGEDIDWASGQLRATVGRRRREGDGRSRRTRRKKKEEDNKDNDDWRRGE